MSNRVKREVSAHEIACSVTPKAWRCSGNPIESERRVAYGKLRFWLRQTKDAARCLHLNDVPSCKSTEKPLANYR